MNIDELKITVKPKYYFGYLQGVTVHINGKKFPIEKNHVYAHNKDNKAIRTALIDGGYTENHELVKSALQKEIKEATRSDLKKAHDLKGSKKLW
jgi:carbonic anhydrase